MDPSDVKCYRPIGSSDWLLVSFWSISTQRGCFLIYSRHTGPIIRQRQRSSRSSPTSSGQLILATSTCRQRSTRSIMRRDAVAGGAMWFTRSSAGLISVIPRRPHAVCPPQYSLFHRHLSFVWSSAGSVLGPILFVLYNTADLLRLVDKHQLYPHMYADDTQTYGSCRPLAVMQFQERVSACVDEMALWMRSNRLQVNASNTEVLWCALSRRQQQMPRTSVGVCSDFIQLASPVCDLGIYLDADASTRTHVLEPCPTASLSSARYGAFADF